MFQLSIAEMTQTLDMPKDQRLIHVGLNWEQFKFIQKGFWEDGLFSLYHLRESSYERIERSVVLSELEMNLLTRCLLISDTLEAASAFRQGIAEN